MEKEISVIMSTYNENENDLKKAIDSILNQSFKLFEFIIILDNPSNIEHKKIIQSYINIDNRIVMIENELNIGLAASLNKGIEISKCRYIARMDADDISDYKRLEKEFIFLENNKNIDIVSCNKVDIDENDNIINIPSSLPQNDTSIKKNSKD